MRVPIVRHVLLLGFFLALAGLEIAHGVFRVDSIRTRHRDEVLSRIERETAALASSLRSLLVQGRDHAAHLSRSPGVRALLGATDAAEIDRARGELQAQLLPYLKAFRAIDRICVFDPDGNERFRCERIGAGVGSLPGPLLGSAPTGGFQWVENATPEEVVLSDLEVDSGRVEVPEADRRVLHYATRVEADRGTAGLLVVTTYAAPLLELVRRFVPAAGARSVLVDGAGRLLTHSGPARETGGPPERTFTEDLPNPDGLEGDVSRLDRTDDIVFSSLVRTDRPWRVITVVPGHSATLAGEHLRNAYAWVVGTMVVTTLVIVAAAVFFVRLSIREVRLQQAGRQAEMERHLQLSEKLSSLGLLTAGVAHEINNPLEGIGNYLALLERDSTAPEDRQRYLDRVRHGFNRIRDIIRDLSAFTRPAAGRGTADLGHVVRHALRMLEYSKEFRGIEVDVEGPASPLLVPGDAGRLEQVFINLLHNAARAMGGRGSIRVRVERSRGGSSEGSHATVIVDDEGPGIPAESLERIFDPFFTTTDGSGLGLWISYGIVRAHGGTVEASNRPGGGARFTVRLPAQSLAMTGSQTATEATT